MLKPLDRAGYAAKMIQLLANAGYTPALQCDESDFALSSNGSTRLYLSNVYAEYLAAPIWRRAAVMKRSALQLASVNRAKAEQMPAADAKRNLRPFVRNRMFREALSLDKKLRGQPSLMAPCRVIGEHLTLEVVVDSPEAIFSPNAAALDEWGLTFDDALDIANMNLAKAGPPQFRKTRDGLFISQFGDCYDASRLHLPQIVPSLPVRGRPVAMVPNRTMLLVTGSDDPGGLVEMAAVAADMLNQPRAASGVAFRLDASWVPFLPNEGHPAYTSLRNLFFDNMAAVYATQKRTLDAFHAEVERDIYVASLMVKHTKSTNTKETIAPWAQGVESLVPEASLVTFVRAIGEPIIEARWDHVRDLVGHLMEPQGYYPERYRVIAFPSDAELRAIAGRPVGRA